jgi:predicted dehydrogenase
MLDAVPLDLVSIVTPPFLHHEMVMEAARRGIHVLSEKPLAMSVVQGEDMLAAVTANGIVHAVDHEFRYYRGVAAFKATVDQGVLGEARLARVVWRSPSRATAASAKYSWWSEREKGGGVLGAVAWHWIDALRWLFGEPGEVSSQLNAFVSHRADESGTLRAVTSDDTAHVAMRLGAQGTQASIDVSMAVGPPGVRVEAYGTDAALVLEGYEDLRIARNGEAFAPVLLAPPQFILAPGQMPNVPAFAELVSGVRDAIRGEPHASFPTIADGLAVQRVLDTVYAQRD